MKKKFWIMCGAPAAGKTTFAKKFFTSADMLYVSRDEIRFSMLEEGEDYFSHEKEVYTKFCDRLANGLLDNIHTDVIADATHLTWRSRKLLMVNLQARKVDFNHIDIIPVVLNPALATLCSRNKQRLGRAQIPMENLVEMYDKFTNPKGDPFKYTAVMEVDND